MQAGYYIFAVFVCLLLAAVIFLNDRLKRSRSEEESEAIKAKEKRLFSLYQNLEDMIESMEEYIDEAQREIRREKEDVIFLIEKAAAREQAYLCEQETEQNDATAFGIDELVDDDSEIEAMQSVEDEHQGGGDILPADGAVDEDGKKPQKKTGRQANKIDDVKRLYLSGLGAEAISKELGLSYGEVSLILNIFSK